MQIEIAILLSFVAAFAGFFAGNLLRKKFAESKVTSAEEQAVKSLENAKRQAETITKEASLQAKDVVYQAKAEFERETKDKRRDLQALEKRLQQKEENLDKKMSLFDQRDADFTKREQGLFNKEQNLAQKDEKLTQLISEELKKLESMSGMSAAEAKKTLMEAMENEAKIDAAKLIKAIEEEARETADKKSKEIMALAIQRYAGEYVAERTVSVVALPSDEMKGRIIGREGRNIRALEAATGIDLIIDDTPEAVVLSSFDPVRREIARLTLEKLVQDGRIHPARIEETFERSQKEIDEQIKRAGEEAVLDTGITDLHPEMIRLLGRLQFRTSYGQNVLKHLVESAHIASAIASELGVDPTIPKRGALLHDIGKAVTHEVEGSHAIIGAEIARRMKEAPEVVHCIETHHGEVEQRTIDAVIAQIADGISGGRPGARRESLETYIKRLERLEEICTSYPGVEKVYAMQAGREVRVMVKPEDIDDLTAQVMARDIAKQVEEELQYPGQIKITVVRETRSVEFAK